MSGAEGTAVRDAVLSVGLEQFRKNLSGCVGCCVIAWCNRQSKGSIDRYPDFILPLVCRRLLSPEEAGAGRSDVQLMTLRSRIVLNWPIEINDPIHGLVSERAVS